MRILNGLILLMILLTGCKKENGVIAYSITYNSPSIIFRKSNEVKGLSGLYTQFGDYITSVTPLKFIAKFKTMRFYDNILIENGGHICELIDNNAPDEDPSRTADFTGNATVKMKPVLWGTTGNDGNYSQREVKFSFFSFWGPSFYQEADLPPQYKGVDISQFNRMYNNTVYSSQTVKPDAKLTVDCFPLIYNIFKEEDGGFPFRYIFGNTNSTRVVYPQTEQVSSILAPLGNPGITPFVWSDRFPGFTLTSPDYGETLTVNITLAFDINDLIQIYAGNDNIPYTRDDIFIYAPNFWERISVSIEIS